MANYVHVVSSVQIKEHNSDGKKSYSYFCITKNKQTLKEVFRSGFNPRRDDAVYEVQIFLRHHPEMINEWIG